MSNPLVTTDATTTTLVTLTPPSGEDCVAEFVFTVLARATSGDCASYRFRASAKSISGTVSLVGSVTAISTHEDAGASSWSATADVSGGGLRVRVTGAVGATVTWTLVGERGQYVGRPWSEA